MGGLTPSSQPMGNVPFFGKLLGVLVEKEPTIWVILPALPSDPLLPRAPF